MELIKKDNRFIIFQILILIFFLLILPSLKEDLLSVIEKDEKVIYVGILGIIAIICEIVGGLMKSQFLSGKNLKYRELSSIFFFLFILTKAGVFIGIVHITPIAFTGDPLIKENIFIRIPSTLLFYLVLFVIYRQIKTLKENYKKEIVENENKEFIADVMLFVSGFFFFTVAWFVVISENKIEEDQYFIMNLLRGIFIYVMIYMSSYYYFYFDHITTLKTKKKLLKYWITILFLAAIVVGRQLINF